MKGYRTKKLAPKPRGATVFRTKKVGRYGRGRLLLAKEPKTGKMRAVELSTPK